MFQRPKAWLTRRVSGPGTGPPMFVAPGHFYSPIPSRHDIDAYSAARKPPFPTHLGGIDLRLDDQVQLLSAFRRYYDEAPFPEDRDDTTRYWYRNDFFGYGDGLALYCMLRHLEPARVVEIGSGFSSMVMLDTAEQFFDRPPQLTFIEPYPDRLRELLRPGDEDHCRLIEQPVQRVPLEEFASLRRNDILFIDSSHVSRVGSDVNYEFFEILPVLASGVAVHVHDIAYPFDYPAPWVQEGRAWTEAYLLRAFLEFNDDFEIVLFNNFMYHFARDQIVRDFPLWTRGYGLSFWMRRR